MGRALAGLVQTEPTHQAARAAAGATAAAVLALPLSACEQAVVVPAWGQVVGMQRPESVATVVLASLTISAASLRITRAVVVAQWDLEAWVVARHTAAVLEE